VSHPAAGLFPRMSEEAFGALCDDIRNNGQREPITVTRHNELLDGRARWRACARVGVRPVTRRTNDDPWTTVMVLNAGTKGLDTGQLAMVAAKIPSPGPGMRGQLGLPPSRPTLAKALDIARTTLDRAANLREHATPALVQAAEDGLLPIYTAERVMNSLAADKQDEFVKRIRDGASHRLLAVAMGVERTTPGRTSALESNISIHRHRSVGVPALRATATALDALQMVMQGADGIDPNMSPQEAAEWADDLSKKRASLSRVIALLKERKDSTK
jgi:ParB-like nuclease domain